MLLKSLLCFAALFPLVETAACSQQTAPPQETAPIVQPGAPGHASKSLTPAAAVTAPREPSAADIKFMQDMIMHHGQAVEMTAMIATRSRDPEIQEIGKRISVSQTDELRYMKQWLTDRGKPLADPNDSMAGMDMTSPDMQDMAMMVGMLTPRQMKTLANSTGPQFDYLFLTGMIQHHTGAVSMVKKLFDTPGAGQDPYLFDFANDVDNTQLAEIDIMKHMLNTHKEKQ
jgi:uncharacterized protein (DUF305 family)